MKPTLMCTLFLAAALSTTSGVAQNFGYFDPSQPVARWMPDNQTMQLLRDFAYVDPRGRRWLAPRGSLTDGASIPWQLWSIVGSPFTGEYRRAAVVHDVYCANEKIKKTLSSDQVHFMFYEACRAGGLPKWKAKMMYWAVYNFGPQWTVEKVQAYLSPTATKPTELTVVKELPQKVPTDRGLKWAEAYFKEHDPSIDEIKTLRAPEVKDDTDAAPPQGS